MWEKLQTILVVVSGPLLGVATIAAYRRYFRRPTNDQLVTQLVSRLVALSTSRAQKTSGKLGSDGSSTIEYWADGSLDSESRLIVVATVSSRPLLMAVIDRLNGEEIPFTQKPDGTLKIRLTLR